MLWWSALPMVTFAVLWWREGRSVAGYSATDWALNLAGFVLQGVVVPLLGYWASQNLIPAVLPGAKGVVHIGFIGAFLLNVVLVDLLYYWEHRAFHDLKALWPLHLTHHNSPALDIWATSRNALLINGLFVYLLVNPWLGYLCDHPGGFFAGAMVTASLDLWRHTARLSPLPWARGWLVRPIDHHRHHDVDRSPANYGANLIVWDRLFSTADLAETAPRRYAIAGQATFWAQFLTPWKVKP